MKEGNGGFRALPRERRRVSPLTSDFLKICQKRRVHDMSQRETRVTKELWTGDEEKTRHREVTPGCGGRGWAAGREITLPQKKKWSF